MIRRRREIRASDSSANTLVLLRQLTPIIKRIAESYTRKYPVEYREIYAMIFYFSWLGLKRYDPSKMKITSYITYYIMGSMKRYLKRLQHDAATNISYNENQATGTEENPQDQLLRKLHVSEIMSKISPESQKILTDYFFLSATGRGNGRVHRTCLTDSASRLNLNTVRFKAKLAQALQEARAVA